MYKIFSQIVEEIDVRQNLSSLRQLIKESEEKLRLEFEEFVQDKTDSLEKLFSSDDAKIRKNTALLVGELHLQGLLPSLVKAYENETQLFVKPAYLTGMSYLDYREYLPMLEAHLDSLSQEQVTLENEKHISEETRALRELILAVDVLQMHTFIGGRIPSDIILIANRNFLEVTANQITGYETQLMSAGVRVKEGCVADLQSIRTYHEMLFLVHGMSNGSDDIEELSDKITDGHFLHFLEKRHKEEAPFYFRIEMKSKQTLDKKSSFVKKLSDRIERKSNGKLINSPSHYEVELRLIEKKEGNYNILVKLLTIADNRFAYRKEVVATSIKPTTAALLVMLASPYMAKDAQVLDPFCGVGTMLIERQMQVKANTSYGIDVYGKAIDRAKINTEAAGQIIHYINKDFLQFSHDYLFDEIFTNMPFVLGRKTQSEIVDLYTGLFNRAKSLLHKNGKIILYSHDKDLVLKITKDKGYVILKKYQIHIKEDTWLFIIK